MSKGILRPVFLGMGLLATAALVGCGGSGQGRPGSTGGTTGTGTGGTSSGTGGTPAGGATGTGGTPGTGGTTTQSTLDCKNSPLSPTSTDDHHLHVGDRLEQHLGQVGRARHLTGSIYPYAGPNSGTWTAKVNAPDAGLDIGVATGANVGPGTVAAGDYAGGGMMFGACVDTSSYTGVTFTLGGTNATCDVYFQFKTFDEQAASQGGGCDASCYNFPQIKIVDGATSTISAVTNPITVDFSDVSAGGNPGGAPIAMQLIGLQWQLQSSTPPADASQTGCDGAELIIGNVAFTQ